MVSSCEGTSAAAGYGALTCSTLAEGPLLGWCSSAVPFELGSCPRLCC